MNAIRFNDIRAFLDRTRSFLEKREAEYNLILGIADGLTKQGAGDRPYLVVAADDSGNIDCVGLMTPPWQLVVTRGTTEGLAAIADDLLADSRNVPGVHGPEHEAEAFARIWSDRTGLSIVEKDRLRIYELTEVVVPNDVPGRLRQGTPDDLDLFLRWIEAFHRGADIGSPEAERRMRAEAYLMEGRLYFWDYGQSVSMAGWHSSPPRGARIGYVYTPPELRRRGYAGAVTAALSRHLLDSGLSSCFLYTDIANPTSNSIYQKIGYRPVSDNREFGFVRR